MKVRSDGREPEYGITAFSIFMLNLIQHLPIPVQELFPEFWQVPDQVWDKRLQSVKSFLVMGANVVFWIEIKNGRVCFWDFLGKLGEATLANYLLGFVIFQSIIFLKEHFCKF